MSDIVAKRYARALVEVMAGQPAGAASAAIDSIRSFADTMAGSQDLYNALITPVVPLARKKAVIRHLAESLGITGIMRNFLLVLVDRNRITELPGILEAAQDLLDKRLGILRVDITSARPMPAELGRQLESGLARVTGKTLRTNYGTDEKLIGGIVAQVGSTIFDGSIRGQLDSMRRRLISAGA